MRLRSSRSIASRYSDSAAAPSLSSARDRASTPSAQSVPAARVRSSSGCSAAAADLAGTASGARLDQLDQCPAEEPQIVVLACLLGGGECSLVEAEAVVEHGGRVRGQGNCPSLPSNGRVLNAGVDQLQGLVLPAAPGDEHQRRVPQGRDVGCVRDGISLMDQGLRRCELAGMDMHPRAVGRREWKDGQRAGLVRELDVAGGKPVPRLVVPQIRCDATRQPKPADVVFSCCHLLRRMRRALA